MESLFNRQRRLLGSVSIKIVRDIIHDIKWDCRLISIRGNRGVGKTTLMLQYIKINYGVNPSDVLYCTMDSLYFATHTLVDLAENFSLLGGKQLFLDEVHKYPGWSREIKEIYDAFPQLKIVISGSSLLHIINGDADLSRRCRPYEMQGLSFREYLRFYHNISLPRYSLDDLLVNADRICEEVTKTITPMPLFKKYLKEGYYPFYDGDTEDYYIAIENIINFVIDQEMPRICGVDVAYLRKIKALLQVVSVTVPYELEVTKLGTMLELNRNTVVAYISHLTAAGLIRCLYSDLISVKRMQKPDKIYLNDTNMLYAVASVSNARIGTVRETFALSQLSQAHEVEYGRANGDFIVDRKYVFEIGGKDKSFVQIADIPNSYVLADDIDMPVGKKLPLWLLGFIY